jgi:hypothetical protein
MFLAEQANEIARTIYDGCKQISDVATQKAEIKRGGIRHGGKSAIENNRRSGISNQMKFRFNQHGFSRATYARDFRIRHKQWQAELMHHCGAQDSLIRANIHEKPPSVTHFTLARSPRQH